MHFSFQTLFQFNLLRAFFQYIRKSKLTNRKKHTCVEHLKKFNSLTESQMVMREIPMKCPSAPPKLAKRNCQG